MTNQRMCSVLIVEDERIVAKDLQETLIDLGYDAFAIASSAEEAISYASERCPDVVLMDIRIKGNRDGIEAAAILRRDFGVPVVFLTAHADENTIQRAKRVEAHGYLMKPVRQMELRGSIELALYRQQMEKRLRERERWFSTTLRSIADAVITVDLASRVTFMNQVAETLTGTRLSDALGRPAREVIQLLNVETGVHTETPLDRALQQQKPVFLEEASLLRPGEASRTISDSAAPVLDDGLMLGAVMVFRDITQQKLQQKQLEVADRLSSLGTMAAGVAHEVSNPLAVIVINASLVVSELKELRAQITALDGGLLGESARRFDEALLAQEDLLAAAERIGTIVSDLKIFSRPVAQSSGNADVMRVIDRAIRSTSHEMAPRARLVKRVEEVAAAQIDETRLTQVLVNLLINATHAIAPGHRERNHVSISARMNGSSQVVIEVADTGEGMAPAVLGRIFEPFFTTKAVGVGTGLGLSICQGIVKSLGGEITIQSEVGKGTTVRVSLPSVTALPEVVPPISSAPGLHGRILVVDDERMVVRAISRVLKDQEIVCAASAREALERVASGMRFDVILCDVMMPDMSGIQFYEALLGRNPDQARRVVFLTGGVTGKIEDFLQSIANPRIEKPFDAAILRQTVQGLLANEEERRPHC